MDAKKAKCKIRWIKQVEWVYIELYQDHSWSNMTWIKMTKSIRLNRNQWLEGIEILNLQKICTYWFSSFESGNADDVEVCFSCFQLRFVLGFCWWFLPICVVHKDPSGFCCFFFAICYLYYCGMLFMLFWLVRCIVHHMFSKWPGPRPRPSRMMSSARWSQKRPGNSEERWVARTTHFCWRNFNDAKKQHGCLSLIYNTIIQSYYLYFYLYHNIIDFIFRFVGIMKSVDRH